MKKAIFFVLITLSIQSIAFSQTYSSRVTINKPLLDYKPVHWGFTFGVSSSNYTIYKNSDFYKADSIDVLGIESSPVPGFFLGPIFNIRLGRFFDLRFLINISFTQRNLNYYLSSNKTPVIIKIPSSYIEMPVLIKYKGQRIGNFRPYIIFGGSAKYDLASTRKLNINEPYLKVSPFDYYLELGPGFDFYFPYFKFSIELKYSSGFSNLLEIQNNPYSVPIEALRSNAFMLSFHFEG